MRTTTVIIAAAVLSGTLAAQESKPVPKDSVRISIPGCTKGYIFTAGRRTVDEPGSVSVPEGMHFRMNGPKKLLAEIKAEEGSMILAHRAHQERPVRAGWRGGRRRRARRPWARRAGRQPGKPRRRPAYYRRRRLAPARRTLSIGAIAVGCRRALVARAQAGCSAVGHSNGFEEWRASGLPEAARAASTASSFFGPSGRFAASMSSTARIDNGLEKR